MAASTGIIQSGEPLSETDRGRQILDQIERALPQFLKKKFPDCEVTVSPATVLRHTQA